MFVGSVRILSRVSADGCLSHEDLTWRGEFPGILGGGWEKGVTNGWIDVQRSVVGMIRARKEEKDRKDWQTSGL